MPALNPDIVDKIPKDLSIRCICRHMDVDFLDLKEEFEGPLSQVFEGHRSWNDPLLAEYCTVLIPVPKLLQLGEESKFSLASYRWKDVYGDEIFDGRNVYIPANYAWFLKELPVGTAGWMDFISHRQIAHETRAIVELMGYFYASFEVIPAYLTDDATSEEMTEALSRGWIAQESAFVKISQPIIERFVRRVLEPLAEQFTPTGDETHGMRDEDGAKKTLDWLLSFATRRCRLPDVTKLLVEWLEIDEAPHLIMEYAGRGDWKGVQLPYAWRRDCIKGIRTEASDLDAMEEMGLIEEIAYLLSVPREPNLNDAQVCTGIIQTFSGTQFTYPMDEVVGTLAVVGVMTGYGPPVIGQREGGLPSAEEVTYANKLLGRCMRTIIDCQEESGERFLRFAFPTYRLTPGLVLSGLGYLSGEGPCPFDELKADEMMVELMGKREVAMLVYNEEDGSYKCEFIDSKKIESNRIEALVEWTDGPLVGVQGWALWIDFVRDEEDMGRAFYVMADKQPSTPLNTSYRVKGSSSMVETKWGFH